MRKPFTEPLTKDEMEYLLQKFKTYLGSVSREIQNRKLKESKEHLTHEEKAFHKGNKGYNQSARLHERLYFFEKP